MPLLCSMVCVFGTREDYEVVHQRISMDLEPLRSRFRARTELIVLPHDMALRTTPPSSEGASTAKLTRKPLHSALYLNASHQIHIHSVTVNDCPTTHVLRTHASPSLETKTISAYEEHFNSTLDMMDEGELKIDIPAHLIPTPSIPMGIRRSKLHC